MRNNKLASRLFEFAADVIKFNRKLSETIEYRVIRYQLVKSSASSGANYEEAQAGSSTADFVYKVEISLREMKESNYWLRLIKEISSNLSDSDLTDLDYLIDESKQLKNILGAIVVKIKKRD